MIYESVLVVFGLLLLFISILTNERRITHLTGAVGSLMVCIAAFGIARAFGLINF